MSTEYKPPFSEDMKRIASDYFKLLIDNKDLNNINEKLEMENQALQLKVMSLEEEIQKYVDGNKEEDEDEEDKYEKQEGIRD